MNHLRSTRTALAVLLATLLLPALALGQDVPDAPIGDQVLCLDDLLAAIQANNPSLRASRLEADALATRGRQVAALPDPMVMASYQPYSVLTARGTQRSQWRVEQQIPFPGKLGLRGDIADLSAEVAGFEAETFEHDLLLQAKHAFYELYRIQAQEALILDFQEQLQRFEDVAATQYEVGTGLQQAILKAQLERNALSQKLLDLTERRRSATETLARLLNRPVPADVRVGLEGQPPMPPAFDEATLLTVALRQRPETDALDTAARRADAQVALARKDFLPDFSVNATYFDIGATDVPPTATGRDAFGLGVGIKVPLQRGRLRAHLEEARLRRRQVEARQEALETSYRTQIADLLSQLRQETAQLTLYEETLIPQAETTLEATLSAYTTGRTDFLDLLDAERTLFTLHSGYEDMVARYLKGTAALERALGITALADLAAR